MKSVFKASAIGWLITAYWNRMEKIANRSLKLLKNGDCGAVETVAALLAEMWAFLEGVWIFKKVFK